MVEERDQTVDLTTRTGLQPFEFLPSDYFNFTRTRFMASVTHHVSLYDINQCPKIMEYFKETQKLSNYQAEESSELIKLSSYHLDHTGFII